MSISKPKKLLNPNAKYTSSFLSLYEFPATQRYGPTLAGIDPDSQYNIVSCLSLYDFPAVKQINKYFNTTINPKDHYRPTHLLFNILFKYEIVTDILIESFVGEGKYEHYTIERKEDYYKINSYYHSCMYSEEKVNIFTDLKFYCTLAVNFKILEWATSNNRYDTIFIDMRNVTLVINGEHYKTDQLKNYKNIKIMDIHLYNNPGSRFYDGVESFKSALLQIATSGAEKAGIFWLPSSFDTDIILNDDNVYDLRSLRPKLLKKPKLVLDEPPSIGIINHCINNVSRHKQSLELRELYIPQISYMLPHHKPQLLKLFPQLTGVVSDPIDLFRIYDSDFVKFNAAIWRGVDIRDDPVIKCGVTLRTIRHRIPVTLEDMIEVLQENHKCDSMEDIRFTENGATQLICHQVGGFTDSLYCSACDKYTTFLLQGGRETMCVDCVLEEERLSLLDHVSESEAENLSDSSEYQLSVAGYERSSTESPTPSELDATDSPVRRLSARNMVGQTLYDAVTGDIDYINSRDLPDEDETQEPIRPRTPPPTRRRSARIRQREPVEADNTRDSNRRRLRSNSRTINNN